MSLFSDMADLHWAKSGSSGMMTDCTPRGKTAVKVKFDEPDDPNVGGIGAQSKQSVIEYRHADMPTLRQGDQLTIVERDGTAAKYHVRQAPYVDPDRGADGTYRCAILTRDRPRDS